MSADKILDDEKDDDSLSTTVKLIREAAMATLDVHEHLKHNGERCSEERANLIGFLIHSLGIRPNELKLAIKQANAYNEEHDRKLLDSLLGIKP